MRSLGISVISLGLTTAVIGNAYYQKKQFYPSVVYITKSNPSMAVIYIQAFILVLLMGKLMRKVFFGQLRTAEFEHLMERSWYAITETCLAFTVFRDDFNPKFVALFTVLLFLKSFHWLAEDRVDYMERSPVISLLFHLRVLSLLLVLGALDLHFVGHAYQSTVTKGASVQLVFGFEYAILITMVVNVAIKYALHSVDLNSETPWDNKAVFLLYTELVMGFIKVILYIVFVAIMVRIYTLPLFAFRPMYYTMRNFKKAFNDVILSRRAIHNMNTLYPDATPEELEAADNVCIICREEMTSASKKLPCNHIFHTSCLRSWFQRQQTCPTCRLNILRPPANAGAPRGAPAAAAAAAAPRPRQAPPPPPNPALNPFVGPNPFQNILNAQQQQMPGAPGNVAQATQQGVGTTTAAAIPPVPPIMIPPFPYLPFMAPPPMPPQNLRALSPDELRRLEGSERESVEARIQCLRNIQIMLDASVLMMQQYSAAAAIAASVQQSAASMAAAAAAASNPTPPASVTNSSEAQTSSTSPSTVSPPQEIDADEPGTSTTETAAQPTFNSNLDTSSTIVTNNSSSSNHVNNVQLTGEQSELRRRRLERFEHTVEPQQQQ